MSKLTEYLRDKANEEIVSSIAELINLADAKDSDYIKVIHLQWRASRLKFASSVLDAVKLLENSNTSEAS